MNNFNQIWEISSWKYANEDIGLKKQLEGQPDKPLGFTKSRSIRGVKIGPNETKVINCIAIKVSKLEKDFENSKQTNKANPNSTQSPNSDERQPQSNSEKVDWIFEKLDLSGMSQWPMDLQAKAKDLLVAYSDIFSKTDMDMGTTKLVKTSYESNRLYTLQGKVQENTTTPL